VNYDSPVEIRAELERLGVQLKKRWGQNFLINRGARERIVSLLDPQPADTVWEIGAGLGGLTAELLPRVRRLLAFEVDRGLLHFLEKTFGDCAALTLVPGDVLASWKPALARFGPPDRLVGNLPYRTASAILASFAEQGLVAQRMVFTVQKELAERMRAPAGSKNYSSFSLLCQHLYAISERMELKPGSFYPAPAVVSTVVELAPRPELRAQAPEERLFFLNLTRALFRSRRKTLWNNLLAWGASNGVPAPRLREALEAEGIDPRGRSEGLRLETLERLARRLRPPARPLAPP
jgi:16S rRNA (adenine1518-N6/adenine1519-N6)-dimethyltransferase